jgi:hypothetical protein
MRAADPFWRAGERDNCNNTYGRAATKELAGRSPGQIAYQKTNLINYWAPSASSSERKLTCCARGIGFARGHCHSHSDSLGHPRVILKLQLCTHSTAWVSCCVASFRFSATRAALFRSQPCAKNHQKLPGFSRFVLRCWVILFYNVIGIIKHDESALLGVCTTRIKRCRLMIPGNYFATALPARK